MIRKMERLCSLSDEEKQVLETAALPRLEYRADEDIIHDGDRPAACNLLLEGIVCRYKVLRDGKRQIMSFQFPGDISTPRASSWRRWTTASVRSPRAPWP
jgi:CRP-like cAMP-binding protein